MLDNIHSYLQMLFILKRKLCYMNDIDCSGLVIGKQNRCMNSYIDIPGTLTSD